MFYGKPRETTLKMMINKTFTKIFDEILKGTCC